MTAICWHQGSGTLLRHLEAGLRPSPSSYHPSSLSTSSYVPVLTLRGSSTSLHLSSASSSKADLEAIPGLTTSSISHPDNDIQELHFLPINLKQTWRAGATGRERTEAAQDRSWALENLIREHCTNGEAMEVIGELQFTFLTILTLNNFSCLEQWKRLLELVFTCRAATIVRPDLFVSAIATLRLQLQHCADAEGGLIDLADEGGSLLKSLLVRFRRGLVPPGTSPSRKEEVQDIIDELDDLEDFLRTEHGWQLADPSHTHSHVRSGVLELEDGEQVTMETTAFDAEDETGEFAPQVVELTAEQARELGIEIGDGTSVLEKLKVTSLHQESTDEDTSDGEEEADSGASASDSDSEEEEMDDLEDMDARY